MRLIFLLFLLFFNQAIFAQYIHFEKNSSFLRVGKFISVLEDSTGFLTVEDVNKLDWDKVGKLSDKDVLNFDKSESYFWLRLEFLGDSLEDNLLLELAQPKLAYSEIFYKNRLNNWVSIKSGNKINLYDKVIPHHNQIFPIIKDTKVYYIRIKANGNPMEVYIWSKERFILESNNQKIVFGIYMGIMIFVLLNNVFLFFSLQKITYLHYSLLVFFYATFSAIGDGYILYIFPELDLMSVFILNPIINQPNGLLYCLWFLNVKQYSPRLFKFSFVIAIYFISYIFWHFSLPFMLIGAINQLHALIGLLLMSIIGINTGLNGNKLGYYFAFAYFIFFFIALIEIIYIYTGNPPYFFALSHVSVAIFVEVFLLAYILSKRFEWEKDEIQAAKLKAQKELLEKITENERIIKEQNQILEQKVAERTEELMNQSLELQEKNNEIQQQSEEISQHNEELYAINEILDKQHATLKELFNDVQSSITYALRIQNAILPSKEFLNTCFDDFFVFYRPRDIVSGDFYWANEIWANGCKKQVFVLADCTGHGVPGAFMSLICANLLNQTLIDRRIYNSADILLHVDAALRVFLNKDSNDNQDGMDCAVFVIDRNNKTLEFAGAKRPLWYFQNDKMFEIKGSSKSIGGHEREKDSFVQHIISFKEKTIFYAYTDGYPDQIGGPDKKKFMTRNLRSLLTDIQHLSVEEQSAKINHAFESWQGESMQIDDVLLIGFELS